MRCIGISIAFVLSVVACSSGSGDAGGNAGGTAGASSGGGGSGGSSAGGGTGGQCPEECFAPVQCVHQCGEAPVDYGCCGCPPGMYDANQCANDAGCHPALADAGSVTCGDSTCGPNQVCVFHCCGGAPLDGSACKPPPPECVDLEAITCSPCDGTTNCTVPSASCSGVIQGQSLNCVCA